MAPPQTEVADIYLQPTTHLSTPKRMKGWVGLIGWQRMVYRHKWSPISCRSSAGQGKFTCQRPTFYHCAMQSTNWPIGFAYTMQTSEINPLEHREHAFSYAGPAVWNLLPDDLRRTPAINSFKRKLKTYLFISAFSWFYFSFSYYVFWHLYCTDVLIFVTGAL